MTGLCRQGETGGKRRKAELTISSRMVVTKEGHRAAGIGIPVAQHFLRHSELRRIVLMP